MDIIKEMALAVAETKAAYIRNERILSYLEGRNDKAKENEKLIILSQANIDNLITNAAVSTENQKKEDCAMIATYKLNKLQKKRKFGYRVKNGRIEIRFQHNKVTHSVYGLNQDEVIYKFENWKPIIKKPKKVEIEHKYPSFREWYTIWVDLYKRGKVKDNTIRQMDNNFENHVFPQIEGKRINVITTEDIQKIINSLVHVKRQKTIIFNNINQCLEKARRTKRIKENPCLEVEIKKVNTIKPTVPLTVEEQKILEEYCANNPSRETLAYVLYLATAMRKSELLSINGIEDVDRQKNTLLIKGTKTDKSTSVIIFPKKIIDLVPAEERPFKFTADNIGKRFKKLANRLGFENITIKSLRTTFATRCKEAGLPADIIQYYMRHTNLSTTEIYMRTLDNHVKTFADKLPFNFTQDFTQKNDDN